MLFRIFSQLHHLRVRLLYIVAIGTVHQCGANSKEHSLILRLQEQRVGS